MNKTTNTITKSALFIALGILLPMILHPFGLGSVLLPMFWPIALSGYFLPLTFALMVGIATPLLSSLITGMPPVSPPIVYVMMVELAVLASVISYLYHHTTLKLFWPLLIGLILSRFSLFLAVYLLLPLLGLPPKFFSLAVVIRGIPGVGVMLILIPFIAKRLNKSLYLDR
jgi:hypothetical protein